jgi:hypothetical protein
MRIAGVELGLSQRRNFAARGKAHEADLGWVEPPLGGAPADQANGSVRIRQRMAPDRIVRAGAARQPVLQNEGRDPVGIQEIRNRPAFFIDN